MNVGHHIRMRRKKLRLSQQQVAQNNWTRSYISQLESNRVQPSLQTLAILAEKLDTTVSDLIGDSITLAKAKATIFMPEICHNYLSQLNKTNTTIFLEHLTNSLLRNKSPDCQLPPNIELYYLTARVLIFQKNYHQAKEIILNSFKFLDDNWKILFLTQLSFVYKKLNQPEQYQSTINELRELISQENNALENLQDKLLHELIHEDDMTRSKNLLLFIQAIEYGSIFQEAINLVTT